MSKSQFLNTSIQPHFILGINKDVSNPVKYIDNQQASSALVYTAGNQMIFYNVEEEKQDIHPQFNEKTQRITAIAVSPSRKFLAIAEQAEYPNCSIYDIKQHKFKTSLRFTTNTECRYYTSIAFAKTNDKFLLTLTGPPDNQLILWSFEKQEAQALVHIDLHNEVGRQVSFSPVDHNNLVIIGDNVFRNYKFINNEQLKSVHSSLKSNGKNLSNDFRCHAWVMDKDHRETYLLLGTAKGEILLLDHTCEFRKVCEGSPMQGASIESMEVFQKGLVAVGEGAKVYLWEKTSNDMSYLSRQPTRTVTCGLIGNHSFIHVTISPKEDRLTLLSSNSQLIQLDLLKIQSEFDKPDFRYLIQPFHSHEIYCIDVCMRKQNVATLSADFTMRIYDYKNLTLEYEKTFEEKPLHLSYHPNGLYILISFASKVHLYVLQAKTIEMIREKTHKDVTCAKFSNGGHLFAVANKNNIDVYSVWYDFGLSYLSSYKGHTSKIDNLYWSNNDNMIYFSDTQGYLSYISPYVAKKKDNSKEGNAKEDILSKKGVINHLHLAHTQSKLFVMTHEGGPAGSKHFLYELSTAEAEKKDNTGIQLPAPVSRVLANKNLGVVITSTTAQNANGAVVLYTYPIDTRNTTRKVEHNAHISGITDMILSADEQFLFTASKDNCLMIWTVKEREQTFSRDKESSLPWSTELLISAEAKKTQLDKLRTLKNDIQECKFENEKKIELQNLNNNTKLTELKDNKQLEINDLENNYKDFVKKKFDQTALHDKEDKRNSAEMEKKRSDIENDLEQQWQSKKFDIQRLNDEIRRIEMAHSDDMRLKEERHSTHMHDKLTSHEDVMAGLNEELEKKNTELKELRQYNEQEVKEVEDLHRKEYEQYKAQEEEGVSNDKERNNYDKGQIAFNKKKIKEVNEEQSKLDYRNKEISQKIKDKESLRQDKENKISQLTETKRDRDQEIKKKEDKIQELKRKNFELEKFRKVLDYKISEDKARIGPKEKNIKQYKTEIAELNEMLKNYNKANTTLGNQCEKLKNKQEEMVKTLTDLRNKRKKEEESISAIKKKLSEIVNQIQRPYEMISMFSKLYEQEVGGKRALERNPDLIFEELGNQTDFLKKNQTDLHSQLGRLVKAHEIDKTQKMMENRHLIEEITELRENLNKKRKQKSNARNNRQQVNQTYDSVSELKDHTSHYNNKFETLRSIQLENNRLLNDIKEMETNLKQRMSNEQDQSPVKYEDEGVVIGDN